ncbi:Crp/Fnr family transcriptional regulator [Flavobacterium sp. ASW18X]|uniref:Crp/Fnr family transcriptional regulator n=1 Tax=Flavobacterium sp. ASW18X TaxID=2572595 RepID=UPI0010AE0B86|nr:Crp/Fnr family transcriptional regulator [Flavobacterium sp. ASW18X]TKD66006.1 Crp/Fnr family transcriptional regulator [Flavobacterium sp. ASW18X]
MYQGLKAHVSRIISPTAEEMAFFCTKFKTLNFPKKSNIIHPGQYTDHEYFVVKGCLTSYYLDKKGHKHIIQFAIEDWWIGDFDAFYNHKPSKLYVEALEPAELLAISYKDLEEVYQEAPLFERYFRILVTRGFITQQGRVLSTLEKSAQERYEEFCQRYPTIEKRVPNYQIANYLGISAESLSRIRKRLTTTH